MATVDAFYRDGEPVPSNHDVWQLNTFDNNMLLARRFFMNAFPAGFETQRTFLVQYKKTIVVVGGGKIEHVVRNDDCRSTDNCGPGEVTVDCPAPRILPSS